MCASSSPKMLRTYRVTYYFVATTVPFLDELLSDFWNCPIFIKFSKFSHLHSQKYNFQKKHLAALLWFQFL